MKSPWRGGEQAGGGQVSNTLLCALTQKGLLLENVLIDERKQRRPRSVVVVVVGDGRTVSFALRGVGGEGEEKPVKPQRVALVSPGCVAHLQRDPVVFSRHESVDVVVPELLHHGRQLSVTLDHDVAAAAALLVLQ